MRKILLLALAAAAGCTGGSRSNVVIAAAGPWETDYGLANRRGVELALEELNASETWKDRPIRVIFRDDSASGALAAGIAAELVASDSVAAVIGHVNSGAMMAAARVYDGHLPAIATSATSPDITGISPWVFRVVSSDSANGKHIAEFMSRRGARRVAVLYENNSYGRGLAAAFRAGFTGEIVAIDPIDESGTQDLEPFVAWFREKAPDAVFLATTDPPARSFLYEARRQGFATTIVGGDGMMPLVGDTTLAEGVFVGAPFSALDSRPAVRQFVEAYRRRFNIDPDGYAALAYDATRLVAHAIEKVGTDRERLRAFLASPDASFEGITGSIAFGPDGDPREKAIVMTRIKSGALHVETGR